MDALETVIEIMGAGRLAESQGVTPMAISQWKKRGVPADRVIPICLAVDLRVTPHELNPKIYPDPEWLPPRPVDDSPGDLNEQAA
ncbi:MAG: helix-turn-helix domain-containing protein [Sedimenticola selenatireducens]|uniref:Helix-turn-helix domain-containing protein n=2 Tax=Sedimenticola selenatireducens TaxID=191960 RepID=A0A558E0Z6_9GAMM|nr:helix-turn-helix domain-containing protein [Sedimenticola selenatireducens]TVT67026.1 MAG: helix-turn-helix domain-containing protein [Sedimenticola selenatireducens]